jgi:hypothetical protein
MNLSAQHLIASILWLSPAIQTVATLGIVSFASSIRRNLGAQNLRAGALATFAAILLLLHAGYFLAPMWWRSGRHLLGAATMLPVALCVLGSLVVVLTQTDLMRDVKRWETPARIGAIAGAGALVLAYVGPIVLMLAASS